MPVKGLADILRATHPGVTPLSHARHVLGFPSGWPLDAALAAAASGLAAPPAPRIGETLVVTCGVRRSLWWLQHHAALDGVTLEVPLAARAAGAARLATRLIQNHAPLIFDPARLSDATWCGRPVARIGVGIDPTIDGGSLGLSVALATMSEALGVPVPPTIVASAAVKENGDLVEVHGIAEKVEIVELWALGVHELWVHPNNEKEARRAVHGSLVVRPFQTVEEALRAAFPGVESRTGEAVDVARRLYFLTKRPQRPLFGWGSIARSADWAQAHLAENSEDWRRARFAARVARRHEGQIAVITWPEPEEQRLLPEGELPSYLAHVVQAAADANSPAAADYVARALALSDRRSPAGLELLGACGRALATMRRYGEARDTLCAALAGWLEIDRPNDASYPLCELLRVLGILGSQAEFDDLASIRACVERNLDPVGLGYLVLARGRALTLLGQVDAARRVLDGIREARPAVQRSARRWLARTLDAADARAASALRRALVREVPGSEVALLAALDEALLEGAPVDSTLEALRLGSFQAIAWLWDGALPPAVQAQRLADEYPY